MLHVSLWRSAQVSAVNTTCYELNLSAGSEPCLVWCLLNPSPTKQRVLNVFTFSHIIFSFSHLSEHRRSLATRRFLIKPVALEWDFISKSILTAFESWPTSFTATVRVSNSSMYASNPPSFCLLLTLVALMFWWNHQEGIRIFTQRGDFDF